MRRYILKRLLHLIPVLLGLTFLTFTLTYIAPSDPAEMLLTQNGMQPSAELLEATREEMGLNRPFMVQYLDWLNGILHGDFGESVKYGQPVLKEITLRLPNTIRLAALSFAMMVTVALPLGILSAIYKNRMADYIIRLFSFIGISMPSFWLGLLLIYCFALKLKWLPVMGMGGIKHILLPAITMAVFMISLYIRQLRAAMLEELSQDYVVGALSRGVKKHVIIFCHVLPNSLLSIITMVGLSIGGLLGGTSIVESIFSWQGVGKMALDAISSRDYALMQGYVIWMALIYVGVNLLVDLSYRFLDPRIRLGEI
ncbi:MAG: nickel ABC transporter permease [Desulfitobacteriaceae bacterium]